MSSVNKVILVGNLGADPEIRTFSDGNSVCTLRMATTEKWRDKASGEPKEVTEWHRVVLFRQLGEIAGRYLKKGSSVYIEGKLKTRKWQDKSGLDRFTTEIEATEMRMLGSRSAPLTDDTAALPASIPKKSHSGFTRPPQTFDDDDIPF